MSGNNNMMNVEPQALVFRNVILNQTYTTSMCISNPMSVSVEFTLRASNSRYTLTPNKVTLGGGQSVIITVRLLVAHYPNISMGFKGVEDYIHIKSHYFEQNVSVTFFLDTGNRSALEGRPLLTSANVSDTPGGVRSRSTSPSVRLRDKNSLSGAGMLDSFAELQTQLQQRDEKISQLEATISSLQMPHPDMQQIIQSRVETERLDFERKSEKALKILQAKDEIINSLRAKLAESESLVASLQQTKPMADANATGVSNPGSPGTFSKLDHSLFLKAAAQKDRINSLEQALQGARNQLRDEQHGHGIAKTSLVEERGKLSRLEHTSAQEIAALKKDINDYKEQMADQADQIQVLVQEVSKVRAERQDAVTSLQRKSQQEISNVQQELGRCQRALKDLEYQNSVLQRTIESDAKLVEGEANASAKLQHENKRLSDKIQQLLKDKEAMDQARMERGYLMQQLEEMRTSEKDLRYQLQEAHDLVRNREDECVLARKEALNARSAVDALKVSLDELQVRFDSATEKNNSVDSTIKMVDAHAWWAYIWHELSKKKQNTDLLMKHNRNKLTVINTGADTYLSAGIQDKENRQSNLLIENGKGANSFYSQNYSAAPELDQLGQVLIYVDDSSDPVPVDEVLVLINSLKETVRTQAIEIAHLRQDHLKAQLNNKKELAAARDQFRQAHLENIHLSALNRRQLSEKEAKLSEMGSTIRDLSQKSDIHLQFARVRTDLEAERVLNFSLRADVESYRSLHNAERDVTSNLRDELANLNKALDSVAVLKTIMDVPGVEPASLLECMCDKLVHSEDDLSKTRVALALAQSQIQSLQRIKGVTQEAQGISPAKDTMFNVVNRPVRSEEGQSDRSNVAVDVSVAAPTAEDVIAGGPVGGSFVDAMSDVAGGHFNVVIDGDVTPQKLLDSLDAVLLAQQVKIKEDHIVELQSLNAKLASNVVIAEQNRNKELSGESENFVKHFRSELEASLRKLQCAESDAEEARKEAIRLRIQVTELKKMQSTLQSELRIASLASSISPDNDSFDRAEDENASSPSSSLDVDEARQEVRRLRAQLEDRTSQLRTVSDSLELLEERNLPNNVAHERKLASRVVSLTAELSAQTEMYGHEKLMKLQLENTQRQRQRDINRLRLRLKQSEDAHGNLHLQIANLNERLKDAEHGRVEDQEKHEAEMRRASDALKQSETQIVQYSIDIDELKKQAQLFEEDTIENCLQVILAGQEITDASSPFISGIHELPEANADIGTENDLHTVSSNNDDELAQTVMKLLDEWREGYGRSTSNGIPLTLPHNSSNLGGTALHGQSPAIIARLNQQFMQRVTDLVLRSARCSKRAIDAHHRADVQRAGANLVSRVSTDRLRSCLQYVNRCRRRIFALERLVGADIRSHFANHEKRVLLLQTRLEEERDAHASVRRTLVDCRRSARMAELRRKFESRRVAALQARIGELESRGGAVLRGKKEAISAFEERLEHAEENLQRWFTAQLPVLLSGIKLDSVLSDEQNPDTFALVQTLLTEKSRVAKLQLEVQAGAEKMQLLQELVAEHQGVLTKWRNETESALGTNTTAITSALKDAAGNATTSAVGDGHGTLYVVGLGDEQLDAVMHTAAEIESQLSLRVANLSAALHIAEEKHLELESRTENANTREKELKLLVEQLMGEERAFKTSAAKQLAHLQVRYERTSSIEFRKMKKLYDDDKAALRSELERVLGLVDFARTAMLEQAKRRDQDTEDALAAWTAAEAEAKSAVLSAAENRNGPENGNVADEATLRVRADLTAAAQAAFTRALDVKKDILSQQNGARLLATILESPGKVRSSGDIGRLTLSSEGNRIIDEEGANLVFPDLSDVVAGRIRALLNKIANGPDLESKLKSMKVYTGSRDPDFTVGNNDDSSTSSSSTDVEDVQEKKLQQDIAALHHNLEEERRRGEQARKDFLALEKSLNERNSQPLHHYPPAHGPPPVHTHPVSHHASSHNDPGHHPSAHHVPHYMQATVATIRQGAHVDEKDAHLREVTSHEAQHSLYADAHNPHRQHDGQNHHNNSAHLSTHAPQDHAYHSASYLAAHPHGHTPGVRGSITQHHSGHHSDEVSSALEAEYQRKRAELELWEKEIRERHEDQERLLKQMQVKLHEVEEAANRELLDARKEWELEKQTLHSAHSERLDGHSNMLTELRAANEEQTKSLKERYEHALHQAEEALEQQVSASAEQIARIEHSLHRTQRQLELESAAVTQGNQIRAALEAQTAEMQRDMEEALAGILELRQQCNSHEMRANELQEALKAAEAALKEAQNQDLSPPFMSAAAPTPLSPDGVVRKPKLASDEFVGLQVLLERTTDELENARTLLRESEKRYTKDVAVLREQCQTLALERNNLQSEQAATASREFQYGALESEEVIRRLEYKYKCKVVELETVLRGLGNEYAPAEDEQLTPKVPITMQSEMLRHRLLSAEQEIETLQQLLSRQRVERREVKKELVSVQEENAKLLSDIETLTEETEGLRRGRTHGSAVKEGRKGQKSQERSSNSRERNNVSNTSNAISSPGRSRVLMPTQASAMRSNSMSPSRSTGNELRDLQPRPTSISPSLGRRARGNHVDFKIEKSTTAQEETTEHPDRNLFSERESIRNARIEISRLQNQLEEANRQNAVLKEDIRRKAKLLSANKVAKAGEEAAAEQWKNESLTLEENVRRLTRAISNKDALIKDLRSKLEVQKRREAELNESKDANVAPNTALSGDLLSLSHTELRSKLRASETERLKMRSRVHHLHDRLVETQTEVQRLRNEIDAAAKVENNMETLRNQLARREAQVRSLKLQLQSVRDASDVALAEAEKSAQAERAQYEQMRISYHELMRQEADRVQASMSPPRAKKTVKAGGEAINKTSMAITAKPVPSSKPGVPQIQAKAITQRIIHEAIHEDSHSTSDDEQPTPVELPATLGSDVNADLADILAQLSGKL